MVSRYMGFLFLQNSLERAVGVATALISAVLGGLVRAGLVAGWCRRAGCRRSK